MGFTGLVGTPWILALLVILLTVCIPAVRGEREAANGGKGRSLLGFRETLGNVSFQCSPSGPCIPCEYSEKNDEKYRCSETGYRLPLKCVETQDDSKEESKNKNQRKLLFQSVNTVVRNFKFRKLMDDSSTSESEKQSYITYRSCIPADSGEKLSVLGFEYFHIYKPEARISFSLTKLVKLKSQSVRQSRFQLALLIMVCLLLISGPVVYLRQKRPLLIPGTGAIRIPANSPRF